MASEGREDVSLAQPLARPDVRGEIPDAPLTSFGSEAVSWDGKDDPENPL